MIFYWLDIAPDVSFLGFCRFGSDEKNVIESIDAPDSVTCKQKCLESNGCVAFALEPRTVNRNCNLYQGGPYTYGSGKSDTFCYPIPGNCGFWEHIILVAV